MTRISLNLLNANCPPVRDDESAALTDIAFFLGNDPHPRYRLTTASTNQLIDAGIILKKAEQGLRLVHFYIQCETWVEDGRVKHGRWLESAAVVFPLATSETEALNAAPDDTLSAIWRSITEKLKRKKRLSISVHDEVNVIGVRWQ